MCKKKQLNTFYVIILSDTFSPPDDDPLWVEICRNTLCYNITQLSKEEPHSFLFGCLLFTFVTNCSFYVLFTRDSNVLLHSYKYLQH
jgi:hypothetical protein